MLRDNKPLDFSFDSWMGNFIQDQLHYVRRVYCSPSCHSNILIRNKFEIHSLHKNCKGYYSFQHGKLVSDTFSRTSTEWDKPEIFLSS